MPIPIETPPVPADLRLATWLNDVAAEIPIAATRQSLHKLAVALEGTPIKLFITHQLPAPTPTIEAVREIRSIPNGLPGNTPDPLYAYIVWLSRWCSRQVQSFAREVRFHE